MGQFQRFLDILLHEKDGQAFLLVQPLDHLENFRDQFGHDAHGGLIEHEELGLGHQTAGDGQHLLFPAAQGSGLLILPFLQNGKEFEDVLERCQ